MSKIGSIYKAGVFFCAGFSLAKTSHNTKSQMEYQKMLFDTGLPDEKWVKAVMHGAVGVLWPLPALMAASPSLKEKVSSKLDEIESRLG